MDDPLLFEGGDDVGVDAEVGECLLGDGLRGRFGLDGGDAGGVELGSRGLVVVDHDRASCVAPGPRRPRRG